jgi:FkbM family methyltransferase
MKLLVRKALRVPIRMARKVLSESRRRKNPAVTRYSGDDPSVLHCCIAYNKLGGYCIPLSSRHRPAAQRILSGDVHEEETIAYMIKSYRGGDIIHAGTYFGDFLPALSRACGDAKVWAFEPNPENYRCALITTLINDLKNVELTHAGLGAENGPVHMMVSDEGGRSLGGASRVVESVDGGHSGHFAKVNIVRIDDVVPPDRRIAILQLDVEGFEKPALTGAASTIKRNKPILILETLPEEHWLAENILQFGYKPVGGVCRNTILRAD